MMKFQTLLLIFVGTFNCAGGFAADTRDLNLKPNGGDVVGTYPISHSQAQQLQQRSAMQVARMKMAGNETVPGSETQNHGARGVILGALVFLGIGFGISKFIGFRSKETAV
jgi:hypothetical protein